MIMRRLTRVPRSVLVSLELSAREACDSAIYSGDHSERDLSFSTAQRRRESAQMTGSSAE